MIGNAVHVMRIATGEVEEGAPVDDGKDPAAKALGAKGGAARAKAMSPAAAGRDRQEGGDKTVKQHKNLKGLSPAMTAGLSDTLSSVVDVAEMIDGNLPKAGKRGPYRKQTAAV